MSRQPSEAGSDFLEKVNHDVTQRHGRVYGTWGNVQYLFPIDDSEQITLDIAHRFYVGMRGNRLFEKIEPRDPSAPMILDLGTGTGIWPIDLASQYQFADFPNSLITGVDANMIQPPFLPHNVKPIQFDFLKDKQAWRTHLPLEQDLIYVRNLYGCVPANGWGDMYEKIYDHLVPGTGRLEQVEIDWTPLLDTDSKLRLYPEGEPKIDKLKHWYEKYKEGMARLDRPIDFDPAVVKENIRAAGFTSVTENVIQANINPWADIPEPEQEIFRWFNLVLTRNLGAHSYEPLIRGLGMSEREVDELVQAVITEANNLTNCGYCRMYVWTAQKPYRR